MGDYDWTRLDDGNYALKHVQAMYEGANLAGLKVDAGEWP